jgi:hypothetical protein
MTPTHCKRGHERTEANLYTNSTGGKSCSPCKRFRDREYNKRKSMTTGNIRSSFNAQPNAWQRVYRWSGTE